MSWRRKCRTSKLRKLGNFLKNLNLCLIVSTSLSLARSLPLAEKPIYIIQKFCKNRHQSFLVISNVTLFRVFSPAFRMVQWTLIQNVVLIYIHIYKTYAYIETLKNTTWNRKKTARFLGFDWKSYTASGGFFRLPNKDYNQVKLST